MQITPDPLKDQFFLKDEKLMKEIVSLADIKKDDIVLEIGAGTGNLTRQLAKTNAKIITFEIDEKFKPFLKNLPGNVEVRFENAWQFVQLSGKWKKKKEYNKIVANPPYSFIEPFLHNLTFLIYDKVILVVPKTTLKTISKSGIFSSFFKVEILKDVPKTSFDPIPNTNSVVINLLKLEDPINSKNLNLFLRQYIYAHENQLIKNSLMEGLIKFEKTVNKKFMTKNEARKIINSKGVDKNLLETKPDNKIYSEVSDKFV